MLTLVIAEAELELVPASLCTHPVMVKSARKRGKRAESMLLDSNYHHVPMRVLEDAHRRGRPDIVHTVLLCALESVLNRQRGLNLYIHTRNDEVIHVDPKTKIPRSYNRFCGLIEQLLETGSVRDFLCVEKKSLLTFLKGVPGEKVVMHRKGVPLAMKKDMTCVVGGFPHGDFSTDVVGERMKICDEPLPAWTVVNELVVRYELL
jgi:rRNA small subunit pseudouridine methyltransferase Nep1